MKILIKNANLISMSEKREKLEKNMDVFINENKISKIGKNLEEFNVDKIIDAKNMIVMPGLVNTHGHVPMSIFRETVDGLGLQDWLSKKIWPMEDKLTNDDIYNASLLSFLEMIKTGTTTINDMYFMTEDIIRAAKKLNIRLQTSRTLIDDLDNNGYSKRIGELEELLEKYEGKNELTTFNVGIHGLYTSSRKYIRKCIELAKEKNLPIHMHFCENSKEIEDIKNIYESLPIEILEQEFKDMKLILAHCTKISRQDIEKLSKLDVSISHCPISNLKLGCGIANISEMLNCGINVTLGTDGQGSGCNLDLFETMKFTALLQKGINENSKLLTAYEVLKMGTINGAKALGLENKIGSIEEGKLADLIIIGLDNVLTNPVNDIFSDIVYNVKGSNVKATIIDGKILMENGKININEKEIFQNAQRIINRIN